MKVSFLIDLVFLNPFVFGILASLFYRNESTNRFFVRLSTSVQILVYFFLYSNFMRLEPLTKIRGTLSIDSWSSLLGINLFFSTIPANITAIILFGLSFSVLVLIASDKFDERSGPIIGYTLLLQSMVNGLFLADTYFLFLFFLSFLSLICLLSFSLDKNIRKSDRIVSYLFFELLSSFLLIFVMLGVYGNSLESATWLDFSAFGFAIGSGQIFFWLTVSGLLLKSYLIPFHLNKSEFISTGETMISGPTALAMYASFFAFFTFVFEKFSEQWRDYSGLIMILSLVTVAWSGFKLAYCDKTRDRIGILISVLQGICLAGLSTSDKLGIDGAWIVFIYGSLCIVALCILSVLEESNSIVQNRASFVLNFLAAWAFPLSLGFYGIIHVLRGLIVYNIVGFIFLSLNLIVLFGILMKRILSNLSDRSNRERVSLPAAGYLSYLMLLVFVFLSIFSNKAVTIISRSAEAFVILFNGGGT